MTMTGPVLTAATLNRRELLSATAAVAGVWAAGGVPPTADAAPGAPPLPVPVKVVPIPPQAPVTEGFLDVGGARLWYWDTGGKGEPIVLSHPATGSGASWGYQQPAFSKAGYRVIGYSRRGHFKSEITGTDSPATGSGDLQKLVDHLGLRRFHLVGSAAGTFLAAQYAVIHPQSLLSVVLGSSLINIQDEAYQSLIARLVPPSFAMMPPEFRELGPSYRAANPAGTDEWIQLEKTARSVEPRPPQMGSTDGGIAVTFESLNALEVPVLLLTGNCDLYACPALLVYVAKRLGKNEVVIIENAGHAPFWEQPEAYNSAVLRFIRRHRGA